jgi:hypothetical protein
MNARKHGGLTLIGFLIVLVVTMFFIYCGMRVIPMYLEYNALKSAMATLQANPSAKTMTPAQMKERIERSLWSSYASNNINRSHMHVSRKTGGISIRVAYSVKKPFLGNISIIGEFDHTVVVR